MPRMMGTEAIAAIRRGEAGASDMPIVALTADAMSGDRARLIGLGFDDHLAKPIVPSALFATLSRYAPNQADGEAAKPRNRVA